MLPSKTITSNLLLKIVRLRLFVKVTLSCLRRFGFKKALTVRNQLLLKYQRLHGKLNCYKIHRTTGGLHWDYHLPHFPSQAFNRMLHNELQLLAKPNGPRPLNLAKVELASGSHTNGAEDSSPPMNRQDYLTLLEELKTQGVHHIQLYGADPLNHFSLLLELILKASPWASVWLLTSGCKVDEGSMRLLKEAGLKGVAVHLEHFEDTVHNQRVGNPEAFYRAEQVVLQAQGQQLATAWHLQPHHAETTPEFLETLMQRAQELGVQYVQVFDFPISRLTLPSAQSLAQRQHHLFEEAVIKYNHHSAHNHLPTFVYTGFHQRRIGCFHHLRTVHYNAAGELKPCPFCFSNTHQAANLVKKQQQRGEVTQPYKAALF